MEAPAPDTLQYFMNFSSVGEEIRMYTKRQSLQRLRESLDSVRREILCNILTAFWGPMEQVRLTKTCSREPMGKSVYVNICLMLFLFKIIPIKKMLIVCLLFSVFLASYKFQISLYLLIIQFTCPIITICFRQHGHHQMR
jgi:hypothetical protein